MAELKKELITGSLKHCPMCGYVFAQNDLKSAAQLLGKKGGESKSPAKKDSGKINAAHATEVRMQKQAEKKKQEEKNV